KRCFVLGNGPSLQRENLSPLAGEITFVMNSFFDNPILHEWQPTYHCLSDPAYFDGSPPTRLLKSGAEREAGTSFFCPIHFRSAIEENEILPRDRTHYVLFRGELKDAVPAEI